MNLLMVDDEVIAIQGILDSVDWDRMSFDRIFTANNYTQAINIVLQEKVDILLCDIEMPSGSGIDLVEWVKSYDENIVCVFLTCHGEFSFASSALKLHCFDYILKPVPTDDLEEVLLGAKGEVDKRKKDKNYQEYGKLYVNQMHDQEPEESHSTIVASVKEYISKHIDQSFSVDDLAALVHLSPDYLTKIFKKECRITLNGYIIEQRMFLAKELLTTTDLSISSVSVKSGYGNYSYFSKAFKKFYGISPREMQQR